MTVQTSSNYRLYTSKNSAKVYRLFDPIEGKFCKSGSKSLYSKQVSVWTTLSAVTRVRNLLDDEIKNRVEIKTYTLNEN